MDILTILGAVGGSAIISIIHTIYQAGKLTSQLEQLNKDKALSDSRIANLEKDSFNLDKNGSSTTQQLKAMVDNHSEKIMELRETQSSLSKQVQVFEIQFAEQKVDIKYIKDWVIEQKIRQSNEHKD